MVAHYLPTWRSKYDLEKVQVILVFIRGWLMGKSLLEMRGFFWAWFIHFWMDVAVFLFIALGSVTPGG